MMNERVLNKKIQACLLIIIVSVVCLFVSCKPVESNNIQYFNNFSSTSAYTSITEKLRLPEGVTVAQYDGVTGIFVTQKKYFESDDEYRYGFCTAEEDLISPRFTNVMDIRGNYAVVSMPFSSGDSYEYRVGIVKIKGEGSNIISSDYGFSYSYVPSITQYAMLDNNYVAIMGSKNSTDTTYDQATIYDYTSANGLLEIAKIDDISNYTKFYLQMGFDYSVPV